MMVAEATSAFRTRNGKPPLEILVTREAAIILTAQDGLPSVCDGVAVRIRTEDIPETPECRGDRLLLSVVADKLGRLCVVATETK